MGFLSKKAKVSIFFSLSFSVGSFIFFQALLASKVIYLSIQFSITGKAVTDIVFLLMIFIPLVLYTIMVSLEKEYRPPRDQNEPPPYHRNNTIVFERQRSISTLSAPPAYTPSATISPAPDDDSHLTQNERENNEGEQNNNEVFTI